MSKTVTSYGKCSLTNRTKYKNYADALIVAKNYPQEHYNIEHCVHCGYYHLTKSKSETDASVNISKEIEEDIFETSETAKTFEENDKIILEGAWTTICKMVDKYGRDSVNALKDEVKKRFETKKGDC